MIIHLKMEPLDAVLATPGLVELKITRAGEASLRMSDGSKEIVKTPDLDTRTLNRIGELLAHQTGQKFSPAHPLLSVSHPVHGYRMTFARNEVLEGNFSLAVRVGAAGTYSLSSYLSDEDVTRLKVALKSRLGIIVVGGTDTGKTTLLNSIISVVDDGEAFVSVQDTPELRINGHDHVGFLVSKSGTASSGVGYKEVFDYVMRMSPERIIYGELDTRNTGSFLRAANTGHACMATLHADSAEAAMGALSMNLALDGFAGSEEAKTAYIKQAIYAVVCVERTADRKFSATFSTLDNADDK